tara:strand:+ start:1019 stop:2938 length:1920 start_codon:yes stop_codon:yes gene_type:complete
MPSFKYTNLNFDQVKESIKDYLRANSDFSDFDFEGSNMSVLIDILAYNTYLTAFNSNMVANESFLDSAVLRENVVSLARNIGYVPKSRKAAQAIVSFDFKFNGNSTTVTLKKGLVCVGAINDTNFVFSIPEDIIAISPIDSGGTAGANPPRTAQFKDINVFQGTLLTKEWTVSGSTDQRFVIENSNVDIDTLRVEVKKSGASAGLAFSKVDNIIGVTDKSNIYLIQEAPNETYEMLFGDGLFGTKLEQGDIVSISYIVTDGKDGNEGKNFFFSGDVQNDAKQSLTSSNVVTVTTTQNARNGSDIEAIDSVRYYAPRMYSAQNRAVTPRDYEAIVQDIYPNTESISVVGGEELDPPEFGTVVLSIKPRNGTFLSDFTKQNILNKLKQYAIAGINQRIEDLRILYIELSTSVYYNNAVFDDASELKAEITQSLTAYGNSANLNRFGGRFKYSEAQNIVDNTNNSITSNIMKVTMRRDLKALVDQVAQYELCFGNQFHILEGGGTVKSTAFVIAGETEKVYLTDIPRGDGRFGDIAIFKPAKIEGDNAEVVVKSAGTVDYIKGEILLNAVKITATEKGNGIIEVQAYPESNDVIGLKDIYLALDLSNSEINIVRDTISSGQQISGIGYQVTSSYSNGSLIRQ